MCVPTVHLDECPEPPARRAASEKTGLRPCVRRPRPIGSSDVLRLRRIRWKSRATQGEVVEAMLHLQSLGNSPITVQRAGVYFTYARWLDALL